MDENIHMFSSLEYPKEVKRYIDRKLDEDYFFIILTNSKEELVGYLEARIDDEKSTIEYMHINKEYRGKHLCSVLCDKVFHEFSKRDVKIVDIVNIGGLPGFYCYTRSARKYGYTYRCDDSEQSEEGCVFIVFERE